MLLLCARPANAPSLTDEVAVRGGATTDSATTPVAPHLSRSTTGMLGTFREPSNPVLLALHAAADCELERPHFARDPVIMERLAQASLLLEHIASGLLSGAVRLLASDGSEWPLMASEWPLMASEWPLMSSDGL